MTAERDLPAQSLLPPFMAGYRPNAIALSQKKKLAIEVLVDGPAGRTKERALKAAPLIATWRLEHWCL